MGKKIDREVWIVEAGASLEEFGIEAVFATRELAKRYMEEQGTILNEGNDTVYRRKHGTQIEDLYLSCHEVEEG